MTKQGAELHRGHGLLGAYVRALPYSTKGGEAVVASRERYVGAASAAELLEVLRLKRVVVPGLGQAKRTSAVEEWTVRRFLATLSNSDLFDYPVRVERGERPDFLVHSRLGTVGVEVTEAVPPGLAKVRDIERREDIAFLRGYRRFKAGERMTAAEARQIARSRDRNFGLPGDSAILESWIEGIVWAIDTKRRRFTYAPQDRNTLVIDDQWPAHDLPEEAGSSRLLECLAERSLAFDDVFVDRGRTNTMMRFGRIRHSYRIPVGSLG